MDTGRRSGVITLAPGDRVQIVNDHNNYTRGCYQGSEGTIAEVGSVELVGRPKLPLCKVIVDDIAWDDFGLGYWWYQPNELALVARLIPAQ